MIYLQDTDISHKAYLRKSNRPRRYGHFTLFTFFLLGLILLPLFVQGQPAHDLERRRKRLLKSIRNTSKLLKETRRDREATYDRYLTLQEQIRKRQELIETLQQEVNYSTENIDRTAEVMESLQNDIQRLQDEYAIMARNAFRLKSTKTELVFLFSADSFNQFVRRWQYLKQYDNYREKQARLILETRTMLQEKIETLEAVKAEKEALLESEAQQQTILAQEMDSKSQILEILKKDEKRLRSTLAAQEKSHRKLNNAIQAMIDKEQVVTKKDEKAATPDSRKKSERLIAANTGNFNSNRGRLPWPVANGVVTKRFGKQSHPTLKTIKITNNGIDIRSDRKGKVRAVFEGKVVGTQFIPGYNHTVIVKHGEYFTVYSNLQELYVKRNEAVKMNQALGRLAVDPKSNSSELHFEVWRNKKRLNPASWLGGP